MKLGGKHALRFHCTSCWLLQPAQVRRQAPAAAEEPDDFGDVFFLEHEVVQQLAPELSGGLGGQSACRRQGQRV